MADIEAFSVAYRTRLDEAEADGSIAGNVSLEVVYLILLPPLFLCHINKDHTTSLTYLGSVSSGFFTWCGKSCSDSTRS